MDALVEKGRAASALVVPLLQDRDEGVRWAVTRVLGDVGDKEAILPLVSLLEQGVNVSDAVQALRSITGETMGDNAMAWREWVQRQAGGGTAGEGVLSDQELVKAAIKGLPATMSGGGQEYEINVTLPERRMQSVRIDFSGKDADGSPVVQLITPCGPAVAEHYEVVLKLNMSIPYGAIGLALLDDVQYFALIDTHLRVTVHPQAIAKSIMSLARQGDALERMVSGKDAF